MLDVRCNRGKPRKGEMRVALYLLELVKPHRKKEVMSDGKGENRLTGRG